VLLVEDNPINAKLFQKMLVSLKHTVILAPDGVAAVEKTLLHDAEIDIIFMVRLHFLVSFLSNFFFLTCVIGSIYAP